MTSSPPAHAFFGLLVAFVTCCQPSLADQPNIVLIMADDMGFSDTSPFWWRDQHAQPRAVGR